MASDRTDFISINNLILTVPLVSGARWPSEKPVLQSILASLSISTDVSAAAATDDLRHSIDYSKICNCILGECSILSRNNEGADNKAGCTLELLASRIFSVCFASFQDIEELRVKLTQTKAPLHCHAVGIEASRSKSNSRVGKDIIFVQGLECDLILGVNACEREERQIVKFDIFIDSYVNTTRTFDFRSFTRHLYSHLPQTNFLTLEALASRAAYECFSFLGTSSASTPPPTVTICASKPSALIFADSPEVRITRNAVDFPELYPSNQSMGSKAQSENHVAAIALGSNVGDSCHNIEQALCLLESPELFQKVYETKPTGVILDIIDTSFLYESAPMYVEDQPSFINCACLVETNLEPAELLAVIKCIESRVGRVPSLRNGPRAIDLDIVFYDDEVIDTRSADNRSTDESLMGHLVVPHPKMSERVFVLQPLNDMIPDFVHPVLRRPIYTLLAPVISAEQPLKRLIPFPRLPADPGTAPLTHSCWSYPVSTFKAAHTTRLMATLNVTPDSFSDGSLHNTISAALQYAHTSVQAGADIIDIGGYSTRPNADFVSSEDEADRVLGAVIGIRKDQDEVDLGNVLLSVDTFRPEVARKALLAGANCINDVYAFTGRDSYPFDSKSSESSKCMQDMKQIAREFASPVILMHSRGEASSNRNYSEYAYAGSNGAEVIEGVRIELGRKINMIVKGKGGIRRWLVIVDPGVGFSKDVVGNLAVIRGAAEIVADVRVGNGPYQRNPLCGYSILIGASKKSFLGQILADKQNRKTEPRERNWATASAIACAVQQRALIVRVHDVAEMRDTVSVAEALWGLCV